MTRWSSGFTVVLPRERSGVRVQEENFFGQKDPLTDPPIFAHTRHFELAQLVL